MRDIGTRIPALGLAVAGVLAVSGCAFQRDVLAPAPAGPAARSCAATIDDQGALVDVFRDSRETRLVVGNDGGWCGTYIRLTQGSLLPQNWMSGAIYQPPAHGTVRLRRNEALVHVEYRPEPGYVGPDSFTVQLQPGFSLRRTQVTVTAPGAGPAVAQPEIGITSNVVDQYQIRAPIR